MSDPKLEFSIEPYRLESSAVVNQLCRESIQVLCARDYDPQQVEALVSCYPIKSDGEPREMIEHVFAFIGNLVPVDLDQPKAIVAYLEERAIGFASMYGGNWLSQDSLLAHLFVHPEYARRGVATELLRTLENNVRNESKVITISATLTGEPFYQANGYQKIECYSSFINGVRVPFVRMEKWLVTPSEIEKLFWDTSQQGIRNIAWLATETEALFRGGFESE